MSDSLVLVEFLLETAGAATGQSDARAPSGVNSCLLFQLVPDTHILYEDIWCPDVHTSGCHPSFFHHPDSFSLSRGLAWWCEMIATLGRLPRRLWGDPTRPQRAELSAPCSAKRWLDKSFQLRTRSSCDRTFDAGSGSDLACEESSLPMR
ncbi:hypothetical protein C0Q70_12821 [Pomacea canaliculata]|uniref:Uncharacterized protein n=1 Tax=Pomacea canaliculata TaxID=400727 RepID=A0A2T7P2L1_POMCA|nr:hypothetical protein C0Q70_12821 [Pomacea canaliculata]